MSRNSIGFSKISARDFYCPILKASQMSQASLQPTNESPDSSVAEFIELRGVAVHNLKQIDLDIPREQLVVICGRSGSGKTSLALDTLYAEGQRRYIETFSAYTRQFLERLDKPTAESIAGIPPAVAVTHKNPSRSSRATLGTATETTEYLRVLFANLGRIFCHGCGSEVRRDDPESIVENLRRLKYNSRVMIGFAAEESLETPRWAQDFVASGFTRFIADGQLVDLASATKSPLNRDDPVDILVDRVSMSQDKIGRLQESLETALEFGQGRCVVYVPRGDSTDQMGSPCMVDGQQWQRWEFDNQLRCAECDITYLSPEPRLFNFNSPLGACSECQGFGGILSEDIDLIVPDREKSIRQGAIAPWNTPSYEHELQELLALASDYKLPVDVPFHKLKKQHLNLIWNGIPERDFGGLQGFFAWLERRKYKMHIRVFHRRWLCERVCETCGGTRLRRESLAVRVAGKNIAELHHLPIRELAAFFHALDLTQHELQQAGTTLDQVRSRLAYLSDVGLGYLELGQSATTLSGGEAQRVKIASELYRPMTQKTLYLLDEPTIGLHYEDVRRLIDILQRLVERGNTVMVIEHNMDFIKCADYVIDIGPEGGEKGGRVVAKGTPEEIAASKHSYTGDYLRKYLR